MSERERLADLISSLKQQRDELALKIHLGKKEAKDEWERVTARLDKLNKDYEPLRNAVGETAGGVFDALKSVAREVQEGFQRIRKSL
jgi:uncharacterized coiled-coil DUF342 family protein